MTWSTFPTSPSRVNYGPTIPNVIRRDLVSKSFSFFRDSHLVGSVIRIGKTASPKRVAPPNRRAFLRNAATIPLIKFGKSLFRAKLSCRITVSLSNYQMGGEASTGGYRSLCKRLWRGALLLLGLTLLATVGDFITRPALSFDRNPVHKKKIAAATDRDRTNAHPDNIHAPEPFSVFLVGVGVLTVSFLCSRWTRKKKAGAHGRNTDGISRRRTW